jgi:hypothetical protein
VENHRIKTGVVQTFPQAQEFNIGPVSEVVLDDVVGWGAAMRSNVGKGDIGTGIVLLKPHLNILYLDVCLFVRHFFVVAFLKMMELA